VFEFVFFFLVLFLGDDIVLSMSQGGDKTHSARGMMIRPEVQTLIRAGGLPEDVKP
jgi:hypothetical protein